MAAAPQGIHVNVGRCVDWSEIRNNPQGGQAPKIGNGWRITGIMEHALAIGDSRYMVRSNLGNGPETDIIFPESVTNMYDCPGAGNAAGPAGAGAGNNEGAGANAPAANNNVEMAGGRKRRRQVKRKARKSRKARKASKKTRKH